MKRPLDSGPLPQPCRSKSNLSMVSANFSCPSFSRQTSERVEEMKDAFCGLNVDVDASSFAVSVLDVSCPKQVDAWAKYTADCFAHRGNDPTWQFNYHRDHLRLDTSKQAQIVFFLPGTVESHCQFAASARVLWRGVYNGNGDVSNLAGLGDVTTHPLFRRQGLSKRLLSEILSSCVPADGWFLSSSQPNPQIVYGKMGFCAVARKLVTFSYDSMVKAIRPAWIVQKVSTAWKCETIGKLYSSYSS